MKEYKIAITIGCFDMLHQGHVNLLKTMKDKADRVIVFLHNNVSIFDNKGKFPVQNWDTRASNLLSCGFVNDVFCIGSPDPSEEIKHFLITIIKRKFKAEAKDIIYIRGDDWVDFPGKKVIENMGVKIEIIGYTKGISSTKIRDEINK